MEKRPEKNITNVLIMLTMVQKTEKKNKKWNMQTHWILNEFIFHLYLYHADLPFILEKRLNYYQRWSLFQLKCVPIR